MKINPDYCKKCKYLYGYYMGNGREPICAYIVMTGKSRGCPVGECDKYEEVSRKEYMKRVKDIRRKTYGSGNT